MSGGPGGHDGGKRMASPGGVDAGTGGVAAATGDLGAGMAGAVAAGGAGPAGGAAPAGAVDGASPSGLGPETAGGNAPLASANGDRLRLMVDLLSRINIFSGLPAAHLKRIAEIGSEEQHPYGATIFAEGDRGEKFYLILDGAVRISRIVPGMGEEALAILRRGQYFGEMSLIDDAPRSAHALVHEKCRLFVISKTDLEDLLFVDRDLAYELLWNFVRTLTSRLRETNDKMTFLATTNKF